MNFPNAPSAATPFAFSRHGTYDAYALKFNGTAPYGLGIGAGGGTPTAAQAEDESVVYKTKLAVTAMQVGFDQRTAGQQWLRLRLGELFGQ